MNLRQVKSSEEHQQISDVLLEILGDRLVEQVTPFAKEQEETSRAVYFDRMVLRYFGCLYFWENFDTFG